jgi:DNA-binding PadR family transcriptional regulator
MHIHHMGFRGGWGRHGHPAHEAWEGRFGGGRGRRARVFDQGDLRLLLLSLIADQPSHGYELIRAIEEKLGGAYSPSPGVVYPTLTLLEELGYATVELQDGGRKLYSITEAGRAYLAEARDEVERVRRRMADARARGGEAPASIRRAMENLKTALRLKLDGVDLAPERARAIAAALDAAALAVEEA